MLNQFFYRRRERRSGNRETSGKYCPCKRQRARRKSRFQSSARLFYIRICPLLRRASFEYIAFALRVPADSAQSRKETPCLRCVKRPVQARPRPDVPERPAKEY